MDVLTVSFSDIITLSVPSDYITEPTIKKTQPLI